MEKKNKNKRQHEKHTDWRVISHTLWLDTVSGRGFMSGFQLHRAGANHLLLLLHGRWMGMEDGGGGVSVISLTSSSGPPDFLDPACFRSFLIPADGLLQDVDHGTSGDDGMLTG